ncbi:ectoine/hydroxyectoine ABC transporter substrate-binding protein EhuB [Alcaligenaceae bacterium SJ-26]|nr:ectoine/hydroxyectoine ABC transporter substrate-binding protein EhuB [Alcaligenaceae bacterium SJ-26]
MNSAKIKRILGSLTVGATLVAGAAHAADLDQIRERGVIRIAVANEIPYGYIDLDGTAKGAGPDVAAQLAERLGIGRIEWVATGFSSLIPGLQADRFDMVAAEMAILPQRCRQVLFSEPNSSYGEGLLVAAGNPDDIHAYEDFARNGKKVAIMAGADQLEMLQALGVPEASMVTIANNADAISTVSTGRASAYAATSLTVSGLADKSDRVEGAGSFRDPVVDGQPVRSWGGFTFAQRSEKLRDAVNTELQAFKQTPEWRAILTEYGFSEADAEGSFQRTTAELCTE